MKKAEIHRSEIDLRQNKFYATIVKRKILSDSLLINLAVLFDKPTGIATYATNLIDSLRSLNPTLLTARKFANFACYPIPDNLTPDRGSRGHLRRLM